VSTELYHYAFGRPSTLEAATDVIEIDFDTTGLSVATRKSALAAMRSPHLWP